MPVDEARKLYDRIATEGAQAVLESQDAKWGQVTGVYQGMVTSGWAGPGEMRAAVVAAMANKIVDLGL